MQEPTSRIPSDLSDTDMRAAIERVAERVRSAQRAAMQDALFRASYKAADRRFTGQALTGFGELS